MVAYFNFGVRQVHCSRFSAIGISTSSTSKTAENSWNFKISLQLDFRMFITNVRSPLWCLAMRIWGGTAMFAFKFWWWWAQSTKHPESVLLEVRRFQLIRIRVSRYNTRGPWLVKMCKFVVEAHTKVRGAFLTSLRLPWCYIWLWIACEKFCSDGP